MLSSSFTFLVALCASSTLAKPGQPSKSGVVNQFQTVGNSLVSAQQAFIGTAKKLYIIDKVENNPTPINGHPAWAAEYDLETNSARPMDIVTNTFCAGGSSLGNGTWLNIGGNQAVTWGGQQAPTQLGTSGPYFDPDGGLSIRLLDPCDSGDCNWVVPADLAMTTRRWYPSVETLEDGSVIIIGGDMWGGFINSADQSNPTFEYFPSRGDPIGMPLLERTLPANLYPITFLLPSGNLFLQVNWAASIFDYKANGFTGAEFPIANIPAAVRTYPASAATVMLPLTPANNWTATILFCGGSNLEPDQWGTDWDMAQYPASDSCVSITPDVSGDWVTEESLDQGRTMGNFVLLPDGNVFLVNGANTGVAGYGNDSWAIGHSYADNPTYQPWIYNPKAPLGSRLSSTGLGTSTIPRLYHSVAILNPDGAVTVSGSNPNPDFMAAGDVKYPTEYRVEHFYPWYYNERRPEPVGLPTTLSYGGSYFNVTLTAQDLGGNEQSLKNTTVIVIRQGFSTHALAMGQRYVQLNTTYTGNQDGSGVLHVSQLPPNPAVLAPGPAFIFVVVNGVPSIGVQIMVGSGQIEQQQTLSAVSLPPASFAVSLNSTNGGPSASKDTSGKNKNAALSLTSAPISPMALLLIGGLSLFLGW
ncbi:copper radical oxidase [Sphaerobolus stellatus SS14]|nr:copper radical oxidase [Sphaerobolus stellatus SS14]